MLERGDVAARLPVQDLARARSFYRDKPGLTPSKERLGGLRYTWDTVTLAGEFSLRIKACLIIPDIHHKVELVERIRANHPGSARNFSRRLL